MDSPALNQQLTRIRDGASGLLSHLGGTSPKPSSRRTASAKNAKAPRSGGKVDAAGKAHRKAPARTRAKKSDETIAKGRAARQIRKSPRG
jgi:hypothetical protein